MLFIVNNPKPLFLASGLLFMLGSVGMGIGMAMQQRSTARRRTRGGRARYLDYLHGVRVQLQLAAAAQRAASAWSHPQPDALLAITGSTARLWERRPDDPDFLVVRVGEGRLPLVTQFQVPPEDGLAAQSDPVCAEAMGEMVRTQSTVPNQAITIDLKASPVVSVVGQRAAAEDAVRALLSELAVLHAPDDVHLLLCTRQGAAHVWEWMKWLPHLKGSSGDESGPAICGADGLQAAISARAARARRSSATEQVGPDPWLVVLADGVVPTPEAIATLRRTSSRTALVVIADSTAVEPNEVDARLRIAAGTLRIESLGTEVEGRPDRLGPAAAEAVARRLAPLRLSEEPDARRLAGLSRRPIFLTFEMSASSIRQSSGARVRSPRA
jgi:S-DNA-T family DNA segregation ATPase FtsK/SpoIIIE